LSFNILYNTLLLLKKGRAASLFVFLALATKTKKPLKVLQSKTFKGFFGFSLGENCFELTN